MWANMSGLLSALFATLVHCGTVGQEGENLANLKHRNGMNLPFVISAGIHKIKILDRPLFPNRAYDSDALGSNCFKCKADYSTSDRAKLSIFTHFCVSRDKIVLN